MNARILVWDLPTRLFHWALALSFLGAFLTAESERWRNVHEGLGYTMLGLLAFRLLWGVVGTRYARFRQFVRGPAAIMDYLKGLALGRPRHSTGHNPLGAVAIVLMIVLGFAAAVSGWLLEAGVGGEGVEEIHETFANGMLVVVVIHILGVILGSVVHRENLIRAMWTGRKRGEPGEAIAGARPLVALLLALGLAGFWTWNLLGGPSVPESAALAAGLESDGPAGGDDE